jgi:type IV secretory pathway VirB9-like protein
MSLRKPLKSLPLIVMMACAALPAYALQQPRAIATDSRIRTVRFSENEVYQFIGHYGFQSSIEFAQDEKITNRFHRRFDGMAYQPIRKPPFS